MKSEEELSKDWAKRGFTCGLWADAPGQKWENYVHDVDELLLVREGVIEFEMNGKSQILQPGQEIFIPAGVYHSVRNVGTVTAKWHYGYKRAA